MDDLLKDLKKVVAKHDVERVEPYDGNDMASYIMKNGFTLPDNREKIAAITNVRNTAIIVTDMSIWRAKPAWEIGFCIECIARL